MKSLGITLEEVKDQNDKLLDINKDVKRKLDIATIDRAPQPENKSKRERFVLLKRNIADYYNFYVIRAQDDYIRRKLKHEKLHFPKVEVLLDFKCSPNSKTLYTRIKENLKSKNVIFRGNNISLDETEIKEEELIDAMKVINDSKKNIE